MLVRRQKLPRRLIQAVFRLLSPPPTQFQRTSNLLLPLTHLQKVKFSTSVYISMHPLPRCLHTAPPVKQFTGSNFRQQEADCEVLTIFCLYWAKNLLISVPKSDKLQHILSNRHSVLWMLLIKSIRCSAFFTDTVKISQTPTLSLLFRLVGHLEWV